MGRPITEADVLQIKRRHESARPKPAINPSWANAECDIGMLLRYIDEETYTKKDVEVMVAIAVAGQRVSTALLNNEAP